jgi:hypothetical protein
LIKKKLILALFLCLALGAVGCGPEIPQLDVTEGLYDQECIAKVINLKEGERAYYTLDGSEPGKGSIQYTIEGGIPLNEGENQIKVIKFNAEGKSSKIFTAHFVVAPQVPLLVTPDGVYNAEFAAKIINLKEGFMAYYTLDGSEPNSSSLLYTDAGIPLKEGDNQVKVIKYDGSGNCSDVLATNLTISPCEPDYSSYFAKLHKQGNAIYYVQSVLGPNSPYSSFPEYSKLCSYNLTNGSYKVVLNQDMNQFIIRDGVVYYEYATAIGDGELCYLWCSAGLSGKKQGVLLDSSSDSTELNYNYAGIMVDDWIYYQYQKDENWNLFRLNANTVETESVSLGGGLVPAAVVDRDILYWGAKRNLYHFNVDSAENTLICSDPGSSYKVFGSFIYYYTEDPNSSVYRMRLDGSDKQQIPQVTSSEFTVAGDRIYYSSSDGIHSMRLDGADNKKICSFEPSNLQYYRGKLFFNGEKSRSSGDCSLYCLDLATNEVTLLFEGKDLGYMYFVDGEIYYVYTKVLEGEAGLYHLTDTGLVKLAGQDD